MKETASPIQKDYKRVGALAWMEWAAILLALALFLIYFTGVISSDDASYLKLSRQVYTGQPCAHTPMGRYFLSRFMHWGLLYPTVLLFPIGPFAMGIVPLAATFVTLLIIRGFARRYLDPRMAWVCILAFGLIPVVVVSASVALSDPMAMVLAWAGMYFAAGAFLEDEHVHPQRSAFLGGLLISMSYNAKEPAAFLAVGVLGFVLLFRSRQKWIWPRVAFFISAGLCWLVFEALVFWWFLGDPLFHVHGIVENQRNYGPYVELNAPALVMYWTDYFRWLANPWGDFSLTGPLLLGGLIFACWKRDRVSLLLLCALVPGLAYLSLGSTEIFNYHPLPHQARYLLSFLPGLALLAGWMIWHLAHAGRWLRYATIALGSIVLLNSLVAPNNFAGRWYNSGTFWAGYRLVEKQLPNLQAEKALYASNITRNRFFDLHNWMDCPQVQIIDPIPQTPQQWVQQYGGKYVLASRFDYCGAGRPKHQNRTLQGRSYQALRQFHQVAGHAPPEDRLRTILAYCTNCEAPRWSTQSVELWRVPTRQEWLSCRQVRANSTP